MSPKETAKIMEQVVKSHAPMSAKDINPETLRYRRDDEVLVGERYLQLLVQLETVDTIDQMIEDEEISDLWDKPDLDEPEFDGPIETWTLNQTDLDLEREKALNMVEDLKARGLMVDVWVDDPEGEEGGFWTSRYPRIGDVVQLPRDMRVNLESTEPCECRAQNDSTNRPDTDPATPMGWAEEKRCFKVTLWDIVNEPKVKWPDGPRTLAALERLMKEWLDPKFLEQHKEKSVQGLAIIALMNMRLQTDKSLYAMCKARDLGENAIDLLIACAKDRMVLGRRQFRRWDYENICKNIWVNSYEWHHKLVHDNRTWIEDIYKLQEQTI